MMLGFSCGVNNFKGPVGLFGKTTQGPIFVIYENGGLKLPSFPKLLKRVKYTKFHNSKTINDIFQF